MKTNTALSNYKGFRFPPDIVSHAVWLYFRFSLSFRKETAFFCPFTGVSVVDSGIMVDGEHLFNAIETHIATT